MITLDTIKKPNQKIRKRVGRGDASGFGKTSGRGTKGQKARSKIRPGFEGGQMPLTQRIPKRKGFTNIFQKDFSILNVSDLEKNFKTGEKVDREALLKRNLIKKNGLVKILGDGELKKVLTVEAQAFSKQARKKIESVKGKAMIVKVIQKKKVKKKSEVSAAERHPGARENQNEEDKPKNKVKKMVEKPKENKSKSKLK